MDEATARLLANELDHSRYYRVALVEPVPGTIQGRWHIMLQHRRNPAEYQWMDYAPPPRELGAFLDRRGSETDIP